jgi:hypothetical protein
MPSIPSNPSVSNLDSARVLQSFTPKGSGAATQAQPRRDRAIQNSGIKNKDTAAFPPVLPNNSLARAATTDKLNRSLPTKPGALPQDSLSSLEPLNDKGESAQSERLDKLLKYQTADYGFQYNKNNGQLVLLKKDGAPLDARERNLSDQLAKFVKDGTPAKRDLFTKVLSPPLPALQTTSLLNKGSTDFKSTTPLSNDLTKGLDPANSAAIDGTNFPSASSAVVPGAQTAPAPNTIDDLLGYFSAAVDGFGAVTDPNTAKALRTVLTSAVALKDVIDFSSGKISDQGLGQAGNAALSILNVVAQFDPGVAKLAQGVNTAKQAIDFFGKLQAGSFTQGGAGFADAAGLASSISGLVGAPDAVTKGLGVVSLIAQAPQIGSLLAAGSFIPVAGWVFGAFSLIASFANVHLEKFSQVAPLLDKVSVDGTALDPATRQPAERGKINFRASDVDPQNRHHLYYDTPADTAKIKNLSYSLEAETISKVAEGVPFAVVSMSREFGAQSAYGRQGPVTVPGSEIPSDSIANATKVSVRVADGTIVEYVRPKSVQSGSAPRGGFPVLPPPTTWVPSGAGSNLSSAFLHGAPQKLEDSQLTGPQTVATGRYKLHLNTIFTAPNPATTDVAVSNDTVAAPGTLGSTVSKEQVLATIARNGGNQNLQSLGGSAGTFSATPVADNHPGTVTDPSFNTTFVSAEQAAAIRAALGESGGLDGNDERVQILRPWIAKLTSVTPIDSRGPGGRANGQLAEGTIEFNAGDNPNEQIYRYLNLNFDTAPDLEATPLFGDTNTAKISLGSTAVNPKLELESGPKAKIRGLNVIGTTASTGRTIQGNEALVSPNQRYVASFVDKGNFQVFDRETGTVKWSSNTTGEGNRLAIQQDGNLVIYGADNSVKWQSATGNAATKRGGSLTMQDDGNLALYDKRGDIALFSSATGTIAAATPDVSDPVQYTYTASREEAYEIGPLLSGLLRLAASRQDLKLVYRGANGERAQDHASGDIAVLYRHLKTNEPATLEKLKQLLTAAGPAQGATQAEKLVDAANRGRQINKLKSELGITVNPSFIDSVPAVAAKSHHQTVRILDDLIGGSIPEAYGIDASTWSDAQAREFLAANPKLIDGPVGTDLKLARQYWNDHRSDNLALTSNNVEVFASARPELTARGERAQSEVKPDSLFSAPSSGNSLSSTKTVVDPAKLKDFLTAQFIKFRAEAPPPITNLSGTQALNYLASRPSIVKPLGLTPAKSLVELTEIAKTHYNDFGRFENNTAGKSFDVNQYLRARPTALTTALSALAKPKILSVGRTSVDLALNNDGGKVTLVRQAGATADAPSVYSGTSSKGVSVSMSEDQIRALSVPVTDAEIQDFVLRQFIDGVAQAPDVGPLPSANAFPPTAPAISQIPNSNSLKIAS